MRKYEHMSREEFMAIYSRQKESGLNIENFCINECYGKSSFYYWKKKYIGNPEEEEEEEKARNIPGKTEPVGMAPINIKANRTGLKKLKIMV